MFPLFEGIAGRLPSFLFAAVIFMDIYMEGMTGMESHRKHSCAMDSDTLIVFLTASEEHMPDAFRFHAYDYISKKP